MYKRYFALAAAAALALSLTACGGADSQAAQSAPSSSASAAASGSETSSLPEGYPSKEITYIYPFTAGSGNDVYFRLLAEKVREMEGWDKSIVIDYVTGASGDVG